MEMLPKETMTIQLLGQSVYNLYIFSFFYKCSEHLIPNDQHITIVLIQVFRVGSMMQAMVRRRHEKLFKPTPSAESACMNEKWIHSVNDQERRDHYCRKTDER